MNHINSKILLGLGIAAAAALAGALLVSGSRQPQPENAANLKYVFPELRERINTVKTVSLIGAEEKPLVTLEKREQGWVVVEKADYPADSGKLKAFLLSLAAAREQEAKTSIADRYAELGVEDIKAKDAKGVLIKLAGLDTPLELLVGNASSHRAGAYVRKPDKPQSWLVSENLSADRDPLHWLDASLIDVSAARIADIELKKPGSAPLHVFKGKAADTNYQVADMPKGKEIAAPDSLTGLASTLSGFRFQDVLENKSVSQPAETSLLKASYRTFDGVSVDISAWRQDNKDYADFKASLNTEAAENAIKAELEKVNAKTEPEHKQNTGSNGQAIPASPSELAEPDHGKYRQQRLAALTAEVEQLNARFAGRFFIIPAFKYDNMNKSLDDLLRK